MVEKKQLEKIINEMRALADHLVPYSFPIVDYSEEQDILVLKQRTIVVDGYEIIVCLSKSKYEQEKYYLTTLQIQSNEFPFLPFYLVCKLGNIFFGEEHIAYVDFLKGFSKVYCWVVQDDFFDKRISQKNVNKITNFEDFKFNLIDRRAVNLY